MLKKVTDLKIDDFFRWKPNTTPVLCKGIKLLYAPLYPDPSPDDTYIITFGISGRVIMSASWDISILPQKEGDQLTILL
jgi:hypothetical protein